MSFVYDNPGELGLANVPRARLITGHHDDLGGEQSFLGSEVLQLDFLLEFLLLHVFDDSEVLILVEALLQPQGLDLIMIIIIIYFNNCRRTPALCSSVCMKLAC